MAFVRMVDEARDRYRDFCEHHGISMAAFFEAVSEQLPSDAEIARTPRQQRVISEARAIDAERRRRD